ncbi:stage II sporulation protein P [Amphibacillus jilinensis]|uniref:stage II sporulation protein P n=1 Tax=Amphibacillus jilinensis TaxID=1216008 RepID=UPI0002EB3E5C|nr:stage II sporulation protein P [Amphibacillus jilinensis]
MSRIQKGKGHNQIILKWLMGWVCISILLFAIIGFTATIPIGKRASHPMLKSLTEDFESSVYLTLLATEVKALGYHFEDKLPNTSMSEFFLQFITKLNYSDMRTLFGNELPGFHPYQHRIIIGQEGTNYSNLPVESSAPLDIILEDRIVVDEVVEVNEEEVEVDEQSVFIYNTHNRESFLPHLDEVKDPNAAFHAELNVTLISEHLKKGLANKGIGALVDQTDFTQVLHDNGWEYWQSYQASKPIVEEALAQNQRVNYVFDIHRDSRRREDTTLTINGEDFAKLFFVIGADFEGNESNIEFATVLHEKLEEDYPGLSRGVVAMGGAGRNGVYNQNISDNAVLIEFGGVDNTLEEVYRSADAFAEVFAAYYWDAEPTSGNE